MAPLSDPERLLAYRNALSNWSFSGYVEFDLTEQSHAWIRSELRNIPLRDVAELMHRHAESGGVIDEVRETRPEWSGEHEYHYDLRLSVQGKQVYVETRLDFVRPFVPDEPSILVVNIHAP
jgi:hypothetical protein